MGRRPNRRVRRSASRRRQTTRKRPQKARRASALLRLVTRLAVAIVAVGLAAVSWLLLAYPERPAEGEGRSVRLVLDPGLDLDPLARLLERHGVIDDPVLWKAYMRLQGADEDLRQGVVMLADDLTPSEVMRRVARGHGAVTVRFTVPEGMNRFEVAGRYHDFGLGDADAFLAATAVSPRTFGIDSDAESLEGYLFPDTYELTDEMSADEVVERMVENWRRRVEPLFEEHQDTVERLEETLGFTPHDVLVLASVVEEEAAVAEERPVIAGVFLNRLRSDTFLPRHRLQADPTVSYGCLVEPERATSCGGFRGAISRAMLTDAGNRYNTYRHPGLPPGPITNPGARAIEAVLAPDRHDYLYFVARGHRRHAFSATLDEHNAAVERYRSGRR